MIWTTGPDPAVLNRRMRDHAEQYMPLAHALVMELVLGGFGQDAEEHLVRQSRNGPGSFGFITADWHDEYHFRPHFPTPASGPALDVRDAYHRGKVVATLHNEQEARRFVRKAWKKYEARQGQARAA